MSTQTDVRPLFVRLPTHSRPKFVPHLRRRGHETDARLACLLLPLARLSVAHSPSFSSHRQQAPAAPPRRRRRPVPMPSPAASAHIPPPQHDTFPRRRHHRLSAGPPQLPIPDAGVSTTSAPTVTPASSFENAGTLVATLAGRRQASYLLQGRRAPLRRPASSTTPASCSTV